MVNAAVEEGAYRGVIFHALEKSLGPGFAAPDAAVFARRSSFAKLSWRNRFLRALAEFSRRGAQFSFWRDDAD